MDYEKNETLTAKIDMSSVIPQIEGTASFYGAHSHLFTNVVLMHIFSIIAIEMNIVLNYVGLCGVNVLLGMNENKTIILADKSVV